MCQNIWQAQQVGELNPRFTQKEVECDYCGKKFLVKNYKINNSQRHFCSTLCRQNWYSNVWSQSDEWKETSRIRAANLMKNNSVTTLTKPQIIINNLLELNDIQYKNEEPFIYYSVDNYLNEYNLIIEVMGDYWHSNPLKFTQLNDLQVKNITRDKAKHTFIQKYYGINILYLWENDILKNLDLCYALIDLYIKNDGNLINYHSFNYSLYNNNLVLSSQIIQPYQDMNSDQIKEYLKIAI